jgi:Ca2+:H+ antiporter
VTPTPTVRAREPSVSFEDEREAPALGKRPSYAPLLESVDTVMKDAGVRPPAELPGQMSAEAFTRAVAVATVSALRHQQAVAHSPARPRVTSGAVHEVDDGGAHGGHDAPSWSRAVSASVLLGCTFLYAIIAGTHMSDHACFVPADRHAELLVDVVDVVLEGSGIDEKFLGVTLFALVPNTTEFMNAMAFAMGGNIALSMEIGSAYALQVCLLQIPAMVAFSAWYDGGQALATAMNTFKWVLPPW